MARATSNVRRFAAAVLAVAAVAYMAVGLSRVEVSTNLNSLLPSSDSSVTELERIADHYGGDPVVVLLESKKPKALLDQENLLRLLRMEGALRDLPNVAGVYGPATALNQIAGQVKAFLAELSGRRDALQALAEVEARQKGASPSAVKAAGKKALDQFDARYGPLVVEGLPVGLPTLSNPRFADSVVFGAQARARLQWRFLVPNPNAVAVLVRPGADLNSFGAHDLVSAVRKTVKESGLDAKVTVSGTPAVIASLGSRAESEIPIVGGLGLGLVALAFAVVPWTRRSRRLVPLVSTTTALGIVVASYGWLDRPLSLGVVAILPVVLGIGSYYPTYIARGARPRVVFTVAAATAASFSTLGFSPLPFVREFGFDVAAGVALAVVLGYALGQRSTTKDADPWATGEVTDSPRHPGGVRAAAVVAGLLAVLGWAFLPQIKLETEIEQLASGVPALAGADHVRAVVGSTGELSIDLRGPNVLSPAAYQWIKATQNLVLAGYADRLKPVVSVPTLLSFLGDKPTREQIDAGARFIPPYLLNAAVIPDRTDTVMTFAIDDTDTDSVARLRSELRAKIGTPPDGYTYSISGLPVVAARGAELANGDRIILSVAGLAAAFLVLLLGLPRRGLAVRALASGFTAAGIGFFVLHLFSVSVNPLSACLGALTAAVACEFTVLLGDTAARAGRGLRPTLLLAGLTSTLGYLALTASSLHVIRQFGFLLAGGVVIAFAVSTTLDAAFRTRTTGKPRAGDMPELTHDVDPEGRSTDQLLLTAGR